MAGRCSILKWLIIGMLVLVAPWVLFIIALYFVYRSGFFGRSRLAIMRYLRRVGIGDRIFRWKMANCTSIEYNTLQYKYYAISSDAPFAVIPDEFGYSCVSAFSIRDSSGSPENYRKALGEILRFLQGGSSQVVMTVAFSGTGGVWNRIQVVTKGSGFSFEECQRAGAKAMDMIRIVSGMVESSLPSVRVKVCRGKEIFSSPLEAGR